jgi:hypothetical protein
MPGPVSYGIPCERLRSIRRNSRESRPLSFRLWSLAPSSESICPWHTLQWKSRVILSGSVCCPSVRRIRAV